MAKEITVPSLTLPVKQEITLNIVKGDAKEDLKAFLKGIGSSLGADAMGEFSSKLGDKLSKSTIDYDKFSEEMVGLLKKYSPFVRDESGEPANLAVNASKEDIEIAANTLADNFFEKANKKEIVKNVDIYLYNLIPYAVGNTVISGVNLAQRNIKGQLTAQDLLGTALNVKAMFDKKKYFSMEELSFLLSGLVNFYTIQFRRGITIKDISMGDGVEFSINTVQSRLYESSDGFIATFQNLLSRALTEEIIVEVDTGTGKTEKIETDIEVDTGTGKTEKIETDIRTDTGTGKTEEIEVNVKIDTGTGKDKRPITVTDNTIALLDRRRTEEIKPDIDSIKSNSKYGDIDGYDALENMVERKADAWKIGSLYIWPTDPDVSIIAENPHIPFQFNPQISTSGQTARYQAFSVLSRIGNLQSYLGTDSITITLNTSYFPISENGDGIFSLRNIQLIELIYNSLTLPAYGSSNTESGTKYMKPPLVKVIIGDYKKVENEESISTGIYTNLLTFPSDVLGSKNLLSHRKFRKFRTFVAANVTVSKDLETLPLHLHSDGYLVDTYGFSVSMNLVEVSPSYMDRMPDFRDYYKDAINLIRR